MVTHNLFYILFLNYKLIMMWLICAGKFSVHNLRISVQYKIHIFSYIPAYVGYYILPFPYYNLPKCIFLHYITLML